MGMISARFSLRLRAARGGGVDLFDLDTPTGKGDKHTHKLSAVVHVQGEQAARRQDPIPGDVRPQVKEGLDVLPDPN
jgi:hypothetical protein